LHLDNPFNKNYNFNQLVRAYPRLESFIVPGKWGRKSIQFANPEAVEALNKALLKWQFDLNWQLKEGNLCPAVPGRFDYLLYVRELIDYPEERRVQMLDIGTGASLIYPLLATAAFNWQCTASEVDKESLSYAKGLIRLNPCMRTTALRRQPYKSHVLKHVIEKGYFFDAVVCNPPFYKTQSDAERQNVRKNRNLHDREQLSQNFGGNASELWYKGGEEAFIKTMIAESAEFATQVGWFTTLVSDVELVKTLKRFIRKAGATEIKVTDMDHGNKQTRFIAWRFEPTKD
jgi:23S rRNA (adenine1618-N6)-methyltransferase